MIILTIFCIVLVWYLTGWFKWWKNIFRHMEKLPGPRWYPLFGTTYLFIGIRKADLFDTAVRYGSMYQPIFRFWTGSIAELHILKYEYVEVIMKSTTQLAKGVHYSLLTSWLGEGLLLSKGSKWQLHRKLITPAFHFNILESFMDVFVEKSKFLVAQLEPKADGKYFNVYPHITNCALDIICETAMGIPVNAMSNEQNEYVRSIREVGELMIWRMMKPYFWWDPIFYLTPQGSRYKNAINTLHKFSNNLITERKKLYYERKLTQKLESNEVLGKKKRTSFIDILLEASENEKLLTDIDIREEVDTFIFEGHDTTTAAISWSLLLLGNNPEIQEKAYEEIRNVLPGKTTPTTLADLSKLKYLECVIKESLRLYPSVPAIIRSLTEDVYIGGYKIPAGAQVVLNILGVHRDSDQFPDPHKFDPDRFLAEHVGTRHPYAYVPFSAGPRNCIGQKFAMYELKTILSSLINNYKIVSEKTMEETKIFVDIVMKPQDGACLKFEKRHIEYNN